MTSRKKMINDGQYGVAMIVAPVLWGLLFLFDSPQPSLNWVVAAPWFFLSLVFVQPVLEEIVFRGWLQGWFMEKNWASHRVLAISAANLLTSALFVSMHFVYHAPFMALLVFIPSLIFGYFRDRYDGWLVPAIALHCFYNAGYFILYAPV